MSWRTKGRRFMASGFGGFASVIIGSSITFLIYALADYHTIQSIVLMIASPLHEHGLSQSAAQKTAFAATFLLPIAFARVFLYILFQEHVVPKKSASYGIGPWWTLSFGIAFALLALIATPVGAVVWGLIIGTISTLLDATTQMPQSLNLALSVSVPLVGIACAVRIVLFVSARKHAR